MNVIDDFSRECLAAVVDTSIGGAHAARELDRIAELRGDLLPCKVHDLRLACSPTEETDDEEKPF